MGRLRGSFRVQMRASALVTAFARICARRLCVRAHAARAWICAGELNMQDTSENARFWQHALFMDCALCACGSSRHLRANMREYALAV